ncbi:MAG TPA: DedA family protein [Actinopolymorphaceae bacterium]
MDNAILELAHDLARSPLIYLCLYALAVLDGFLPAFPSESVVVAAGAFAASGQPDLLAVIVVSALGAFTGDHLSYAIGRTTGRRLVTRAPAASRRRRAFDRAARELARRGGLALVVARYIPGGRTAVTLTMGASRFPLRTFACFDGLAALSWGTYSGSVGYLGGLAFEREPLKGVLLGLTVAISVTVVVETSRYLATRRRGSRPPSATTGASSTKGSQRRGNRDEPAPTSTTTGPPRR